MYSYIKGTLEEVSEDLIVVENNGIGYNIRISARMLDALPARGEQVKIYTYLYVKEDAFSLFGFPSRDELEMFKLLINVSGIGPKGGLAVLSVLSANDLRFAIVAEDAKTISKAPGIGSKTAKRLIIELMGKHSNIIFCDEKGMILDSIKHVSSHMSSVREVLPGREYFIPNTRDKENPLTVSEEEFTQHICEYFQGALHFTHRYEPGNG